MDTATPFASWAVLELMGHRRLAGYVQEVQIAGAGMLRIDVPAEAGDATQFISPASLYAMTPCTEATARVIAKGSSPAPVHEYEFPSLRGKALPAADDDDFEDDDETPRETLQRLVDEDGFGAVLDDLIGIANRADPGQLYRTKLVSTAGVEAIAVARDAQILQGYDAAHDDAIESAGKLAAAASYILYSADPTHSIANSPDWVTRFIDKHKADRLKMLASAGALIAAEIDRLTRAETEAPSTETIADQADTNQPAAETPPPAPETIAPVENEVPF